MKEIKHKCPFCKTKNGVFSRKMAPACTKAIHPSADLIVCCECHAVVGTTIPYNLQLVLMRLFDLDLMPETKKDTIVPLNQLKTLEDYLKKN